MVFLLQFSLVFARWNRRLAHESIPSKLVKKMPIAFNRYRQGLVLALAALARLQRSDYLQTFAYTVENCTATTPARSKICCSVKSSVANSAARPLMSDAVITAAN